MSQILDRSTLLTEFEAYAKRSFNVSRQDTFIQLSEARIYRDLRPRENILKATLTPTTNLFDLPADFIDLRELSAKKGNRVVVLSSVGRHRLSLATSQTGFPVVYSIIGTQIEVGPITLPGEFTLWYWRKFPALVNPTDTNVLLTTYPYIWLYAMMVEGSIYVQDDTMRQLAIETYLTEINRVNQREAEGRFGEAPVIGVG
jgi:hypothetical protein